MHATSASVCLDASIIGHLAASMDQANKSEVTPSPAPVPLPLFPYTHLNTALDNRVCLRN